MAQGADLLALSDLLHSGHDAEEDRHQANEAHQKILTPGDIGPPRATDGVSQSRPPSDPKAIWSEEEASQEPQDCFHDPDDKRPMPEYDIVYKQSVMTEDTFLGMAGKTPGSQDCTHIVVKVVFPGCQMRDLEVDVRQRSFLAAGPKLRLATYLPLPVDETNGVAKWDARKETLAVTLPVVTDQW